MGYEKANGEWADTEDVELHASGEETADGNGDSVEVGDRGVVRLILDVTAVGADADETLDVTVETSFDDSTWRSLGTFTQVPQTGGATSERKSFSGADRFIRCTWDVEGTTPEFTFEVSGEAV